MEKVVWNPLQSPSRTFVTGAPDRQRRIVGARLPPPFVSSPLYPFCQLVFSGFSAFLSVQRI